MQTICLMIFKYRLHRGMLIFLMYWVNLNTLLKLYQFPFTFLNMSIRKFAMTYVAHSPDPIIPTNQSWSKQSQDSIAGEHLGGSRAGGQAGRGDHNEKGDNIMGTSPWLRRGADLEEGVDLAHSAS